MDVLCLTCNEYKSLDQFRVRKERGNTPRKMCRSCELKANNERATNARIAFEETHTKQCSECSEHKLYIHFPTVKNRKTGRLKYCNACESLVLAKRGEKYQAYRKQSTSEYGIDNAETIRNRKIKKIYGITQEEYRAICDAQEYKCAICQETPSVLVIDHDHSTGKVRGLLCRQCNSGIGMLKDDIVIVENAFRYLEKARDKA